MKERYARIFPLSLTIHLLTSQVLDTSWAKQRHVYTKVIKPWLWNDHGTPFLGWDHREVRGLQPKVYWKSPILSVNPQILIAHSLSPSFKSRPRKFPYNPGQHNPYLPCGILWRSFIHWIWCALPSCKPKAGWICDILNQCKFKNSPTRPMTWWFLCRPALRRWDETIKIEMATRFDFHIQWRVKGWSYRVSWMRSSYVHSNRIKEECEAIVMFQNVDLRLDLYMSISRSNGLCSHQSTNFWLIVFVGDGVRWLWVL